MYSVASTLDSYVQPSVSLAVFLALALAFLSRHAPWLRRMQLHAFHPFRSLCELTLHVRGSRSAMSSTAVSVLRGRSHPFRRNGWTCTVRAIAVRFRRARVSPSSRSSFPSLAARTLTSRCSGCGTKHDAHAPSRRRTRSVRRSRRFPRRFFFTFVRRCVSSASSRLLRPPSSACAAFASAFVPHHRDARASDRKQSTMGTIPGPPRGEPGGDRPER